MIARIEGDLIEKNPAYVIIDCHGVGYQLNITLNTFTHLPEKGNCVLQVSQIIRDDAHLLCRSVYDWVRVCNAVSRLICVREACTRDANASRSVG